MNKVEFKNHLLNWYKDMGVENNTGFVSHGGAMLMMGLRERTDDIDLNVQKVLWEKLLALGYVVTHLNNPGLPPTKLISVTDVIDVHLVEEFPELLNEDGVLYTSPEQTILDKQLLMRDKDIKDIAIIEKYLSSK